MFASVCSEVLYAALQRSDCGGLTLLSRFLPSRFRTTLFGRRWWWLVRRIVRRWVAWFVGQSGFGEFVSFQFFRRFGRRLEPLCRQPFIERQWWFFSRSQFRAQLRS